MKELKFHVTRPGEMMAGIRGMNEVVTISCESSFCGSHADNDCILHFKTALEEWFESALVETVDEYRERMKKEGA